MARPGFVHDVDERTPPLLVHAGDALRLERFPLGTQVIYPADSLPALPRAEAVDEALDHPVGSEPLSARLRPGMRLRLAFDDITAPVPRMRTPDVRATVLEAVLRRAAAAGVDDVALVAATGLHRRMTQAELERVVGERVFRSFHAGGLLTNHDAEDADRLTGLGHTEHGEVSLDAAAADADLLVFVHVVTGPGGGGAEAVARGLGSTATIGRLDGWPEKGDPVSGPSGAATVSARRAAVADLVAAAVPLFVVEVVLDQDVFPAPLDYLGKREWELSAKERAGLTVLRRGLALAPPKARRRLVDKTEAAYHATLVTAGAAADVDALSQAQIRAQQLVGVNSPVDVGVIGVGEPNRYGVDSSTNPILAAWSGLADIFGAHTGTPFVRPGGALVLFHPMSADFSPLHHPSYVDFFADVLSSTTDPAQIRADFEDKFASDPWYVHLYRTGFAFHGVHPFHLWYHLSAARAHCGDIVWVGADRRSVERLGFRAASTLPDALEIVASTVGRTPSIAYLHTPPRIVVDIT